MSVKYLPVQFIKLFQTNKYILQYVCLKVKKVSYKHLFLGVYEMYFCSANEPKIHFYIRNIAYLPLQFIHIIKIVGKCVFCTKFCVLLC